MERYPDLKKLRIRHYPDPKLREKAGQIREIDAFLKEMSERMTELMRQAKGLGLAATQVGWPYRFVVVNPACETGKEQTFINPVVVAREGKIVEEEACLSVPGVWARVRRARRVRVRAQLLNGEEVELEAEGLAARMWQHELDHLDGGLFIDRLGLATKILLANRLRELECIYKTDNMRGDETQDAEHKAH